MLPSMVQDYSDENGDPWPERRVSEYLNEHRSSIEQKVQRDSTGLNTTSGDHNDRLQA